MERHKIIIVDDEPLAQELLERYVADFSSLEHAGSFSSAIEALNFLRTGTADIICLDIKMPGLSGIDLAKLLDPKRLVVFTTAHRQFAPEAFEVQAVDYLLKPISFSRFSQAIERCQSRIKNRSQSEKVVIRAERRDFLLEPRDIYYAEGIKDYTRFHTKEGRLLSRGSLGVFLSQPAFTFLRRIHRSYAINPQHVNAQNNSEIQIGEVILPVGQKYR